MHLLLFFCILHLEEQCNSSSCPASFLAIGLVSMFYFSLSNRYVMVLMHIFLVVNDVENLFMCLFFIPISSLFMWILKLFGHFLIKFLFSNSWVMWVLYMCWIQVLCQMWELQIFSPCVAPLIIFLMCLSQNKKFPFWSSPVYHSFLLWFMLMVSCEKKTSLPNPRSWNYFSCFLLKVS